MCGCAGGTSTASNTSTSRALQAAAQQKAAACDGLELVRIVGDVSYPWSYYSVLTNNQYASRSQGLEFMVCNADLPTILALTDDAGESLLETVE